MLHKYRYGFLIGFILILGLVVAISERILSQRRIDFIVDLHQSAIENIAFAYDLNLHESTHETIDSASGIITPSLPDKSTLQLVLRDFPSFLQQSRHLSERLREKYTNYDRSQFNAIRVTEEQQEYELQMENGIHLHLTFLGERKMVKTTLQSDTEKRSLTIQYSPHGQLERMLFGMWPRTSMGIDLAFYRNGMPRKYVMIYQGMYLGPVVSWNEDGTIRDAIFHKRPVPLTIDKETN